jgi:Flp pilus assembly protein TadD
MLIAEADKPENDERRTDLLLRAAQLLLDEAHAPAEALDVVELVRSQSPQDLDGLLLWARVQVALGRANHALIMLYEAAEQHPDKHSAALAGVHLAIGKAHLAVDEIVEAFDALDGGFAIDWRTGDIAMLLAMVALDLDDEKTAERAFSAVTTLPPRKPNASPGADGATKAIAYYHLASMAFRKGDFAKARRLAGKAASGDPGHVAARALLERLDADRVTATEASALPK